MAINKKSRTVFSLGPLFFLEKHRAKQILINMVNYDELLGVTF